MTTSSQTGNTHNIDHSISANSSENPSLRSNLLAGKKGVIMGVASDRSLAWHIAHQAYLDGAEIMITYQDDIFLKRIAPLADQINSKTIKCNVSDDASLDETFKNIEEQWGKIDFIVHAIAFSDKNELRGQYLNTSRANFINTLDVSCYSLTAVAQRAAPIMNTGGSFLTLTYYGAEKFIPNYNVMGVAKAALEASLLYLANDLGGKGIRINAISAGPVRTLAASGIADFREMLDYSQNNTPMKRNISGEDVAYAATFLLSDRSQNITGEVLHVDSGMHVMGMPNFEQPA